MATERFVRPTHMVHEQDRFRDQEVGLTHPELPSHIRLRDNGDIEIVAADGLAIIMHPQNRSITFLADQVKFITKDDGFRWNNKALNSKATSFQEPTFIALEEDDTPGMYQGVDQFLFEDDADFPDLRTIDPETGAEVEFAQYYRKYGRSPSFGGNIYDA